MGQNELLPIYILEILHKYASSDRKMTQNRLMELLDLNYNISFNRKTISKYIRKLREENYIAGQRGIYPVHLFTDTELRLLIDGVLFGKHVPEENARQLITKLKGLSNLTLQNRIKHVHYLEGIQHTDNDQLYTILDTLDEAIERGKQVELTKCSYDIHGNLKERGTTVVSPYYIVTSKSMYYLICYDEGRQEIENRRLDRIAKVTILPERAVALQEIASYGQCPFQLSQYMREHIYMFSGSCEKITLRVDKQAIGDVIDWFGKEYRIVEETEEFVSIKLEANCNAVYYWALQYGSRVEVLAPLKLRERIRDGLKEMLEKYGGG